MTGDARSASSFETRTPRVLTWGNLFLISAYGFLLLLPTIGVLLAVSVSPYGTGTWLLPSGMLLLSLYLLPLGFGNPRVSRLVREIDPGACLGPGRWVVQVTCEPRLATGLRGLVEDADDIGCLRIENGSVAYLGDRMSFSLSAESIRSVDRMNIGLRGLFMYQSVVRISLEGVPGVRGLRISGRSAWCLPTAVLEARRLAGKLRELRSPESDAI